MKKDSNYHRKFISNPPPSKKLENLVKKMDRKKYAKMEKESNDYRKFISTPPPKWKIWWLNKYRELSSIIKIMLSFLQNVFGNKA